MDYETAWEEVQVLFGLEGRQMSLDSGMTTRTREFLMQKDLVDGVLEYLQADLEFRIRNDVATSFSGHFLQTVNDSDGPPTEEAIFAKAVADLHFRLNFNNYSIACKQFHIAISFSFIQGVSVETSRR